MRRLAVLAVLAAAVSLAAPPASADCAIQSVCRAVCLVYPRFCTIA